jgi:hypothetical protein
MFNKELKVGERIVVHNMPYPAYVESIVKDHQYSRVVIHVDWREHGKSKVYLHDEGNTWVRLANYN